MTGSLAGRRIAVTRARPQAEELAAPLRELGADVLLAPLIRIEETPQTPELLRALAAGRSYDWVVFTSVNGVDLFAEACRRAGGDLRRGRVACVGPATAEAARRHGLEPVLVPSAHTGRALADALVAGHDMGGRRILLPRAAGGGGDLPGLLRAAGAEVDDVALYRSVPDAEGAAVLRAAIIAEILDIVTFTSGSSLRYFKQLVGDVGRAHVAVIGPVSAEVARELGLDVAIQGNPNTVGGLVAAVVRFFGEKES